MAREIAIIGSGQFTMAFPNGLTITVFNGDDARADDCERDWVFVPFETREAHYSSTCEAAVHRGDENVTAWFGPADTDPVTGEEVGPSLGHLAPVAVADLVARVAAWKSQQDLVRELKEAFGIADDDLTGDCAGAIDRLHGILNEYSDPDFDSVEAVREARHGRFDGRDEEGA